MRELLAADIALLLQAAQRWHNRSHQLKDNRSADIRHDTQRRDGTLNQGTTGEHIVETYQRTRPTGGLVAEELLQWLGINARQRNVRGHAGHEQQRKRVENARPELGDFQRVRESGKHSVRRMVVRRVKKNEARRS